MTIRKVAFVTGAAHGVGNGRAIALRLAKDGFDVGVGDILYEQAQDVAQEIKELGQNSKAVKMDVSNFNDVQAGLDEVKASLGQIDVLVNNAAIMGNMATISKMKVSAWDKEIAVNLSGAFYCLKNVFDNMVKKKWGRIINIASLAGRNGGYGQSSYSASKAGIVGLTKTIALEGAVHNITSNAIILGVICTDTYLELPEQVRNTIKKRVPVGREGTPEEVASLVGYIASEASSYLTGADIVLSGGMDLFVI